MSLAASERAQDTVQKWKALESANDAAMVEVAHFAGCG
jgi:hypothetical protein